ncbi:unnamed protein product [Ranitomeya imitator]|uniref:Uncharacterized protein n=1 Tax=Ranitomeya imitator TaxID=111125 RepID=A0ABN9LK05_9NEOB|nr:unnamed protein product [Ranitomeya imitator]
MCNSNRDERYNIPRMQRTLSVESGLTQPNTRSWNGATQEMRTMILRKPGVIGKDSTLVGGGIQEGAVVDSLKEYYRSGRITEESGQDYFLRPMESLSYFGKRSVMIPMAGDHKRTSTKNKTSSRVMETELTAILNLNTQLAVAGERAYDDS